MKIKGLLSCIAALLCLVATTMSAQADVIVNPMDITLIGVNTTLTNQVAPVRGNADQFEVRSRQNGQETDNRQLVTFANFDVSAFAPGSAVTADLTFDYTSRLNTVNAAPPAVVGRVLTAWDTSGNNNPLFSYGYDNINGATVAADTAVLVQDIQNTTPALTGQSVDLTSIVQGWIDGTFANNGLVFFIDGEASQGAGFSNVQLDITPVPEPTSMALLGLGSVLLVVRRRK